MKLLTKEIQERLPKLYETEDIPCEKKIAQVKFFSTISPAVWYGIEYDPEERIFFGYVNLFGIDDCAEYGYFSLDELESVTIAPYGFVIERDLYFKPKTMKEILQ